MKLVIVESPYAGEGDVLEKNVRYARACLADCLQRGEAPYASHLLYTQRGVLDDNIPAERKKGIDAGFAWRKVAELTAVYRDLGITAGMQQGIMDAEDRGCHVEYRQLEGEWDGSDDWGHLVRDIADGASPLLHGDPVKPMDTLEAHRIIGQWVPNDMGHSSAVAGDIVTADRRSTRILWGVTWVRCAEPESKR